MTTVSFVINGRNVEAEVEPRLNLADFLREYQALTATHVGCEHGVCGACTVWIDGAPARSCITFAAAANGATITTLEGFEHDPVMDALREAFAEHHGLQCGFCTPGMLMTARDILTRLPDADEKRIRLELSGNLCRCTGYVGIVNAVQAAQAAVKKNGLATQSAGRAMGPVGAHRPAMPDDLSTREVSRRTPRPAISVQNPAENLAAIDWAAVEREGVELHQSFAVPHPRDKVWAFFADVDQVARCMPGARLTTPLQNGRSEGEINVKLGPIVSALQGVLDIARDDAGFRGVIRGAGRDTKSPSSARAIISYVVGAPSAASSTVDVSIKFLLSGPLAQFTRFGLIKDVADHLTRAFTQNLEARLSGAPAAAEIPQTLDAGAVARSAVWARIAAWFRKITGG